MDTVAFQEPTDHERKVAARAARAESHRVKTTQMTPEQIADWWKSQHKHIKVLSVKHEPKDLYQWMIEEKLKTDKAEAQAWLRSNKRKIAAREGKS